MIEKYQCFVGTFCLHFQDSFQFLWKVSIFIRIDGATSQRAVIFVMKITLKYKAGWCSCNALYLYS
jgi:hypothetical protein